ncbi:MAG TPA: ABC transporter ATP-binding protein [Anaerolineae bacterium]|nr:ABC transporter ATP-binding protein [Anaerolineae bacterium]
MGFILDGLDTEDYDRQYNDSELVRRITHYFSRYSRHMLYVATALVLTSAAGTATPIFIARAVDVVAAQPELSIILFFATTVTLLGATNWFFNYIQQYFTAYVVGNVVLDLRRAVFTATVAHDLSFYDTHSSGKIVSRITSDTQTFAETVSLTMNLLSQLLIIIILTGWLFTVNLRLTLVMLAFTPIAIALALSFRRLARHVTRQAQRITAVINAQIQESISGIIVAKTFRQEHAIYDTFHTNNIQGYYEGLRRGLTLMSIFPVISIAAGAGTAAIVYIGALATTPGTLIAADNPISPGDWYLFMQGVTFFWWPMLNVASFWSQFQDGLSAAERVFALIDAEPKVIQTDNHQLGHITGEIQFKNIKFGYNDAETVLPNFSLTIPPRQTIAFVGHTGAGKSSIARLLTRYYEYQAGQLLIDGHDIRTIDLRHYRQQIGIVPQSPFLFSGTVRQNIGYGVPEATDEQIEAAVNQISNGNWLNALAHGLDTDVGERGSNLSMGQRQLVALARVILKNPAIFILDEATASIDPFTETQIQEGLDTIMAERTAIVIAHRLSTVKNADHIIVMAAGAIIEQGTHDQLMTQNGHYADLYNTYFRHQSLSYIDSKGWETNPATNTAST